MFTRNANELYVEDVALARIADQVGTPTYVYSRSIIEDRYAALQAALSTCEHRICYAVKANSNLSILALMARLGAGFDIVSGGELERVLRVGAAAESVVFSGVGKSAADLDFALKAGVGCFNVESRAELMRLERRAKALARRPRIAIRVNPDVDAKTHPYISTGLKENKFGVPETEALDLCRYAHNSEALEISGIDCHIGSQINEVEPFIDALTHLMGLIGRLRDEGIELEHLDIGGGMGVEYHNEGALDIHAYGAAIAQVVAASGLTLIVEPGRYLVSDAGVLLTRIEYLKPADGTGMRNFAVVDAAMNDLIRPALYQAWHRVETVHRSTAEPRTWDIVGPICESGDFLAVDRHLALDDTSLLAIFSSGAYGFVQSSNYNTRGRCAEVLVDNDVFHVVRKRETVSDMLRLESIV
ncbi:MAG: diaminopimelate decarboxylase [Gammaproteobacteria bacterium]|nr:diaminopimelate decarboxylase [Gammaproteobacteria bacterium]